MHKSVYGCCDKRPIKCYFKFRIVRDCDCILLANCLLKWCFVALRNVCNRILVVQSSFLPGLLEHFSTDDLFHSIAYCSWIYLKIRFCLSKICITLGLHDTHTISGKNSWFLENFKKFRLWENLRCAVWVHVLIFGAFFKSFWIFLEKKRKFFWYLWRLSHIGKMPRKRCIPGGPVRKKSHKKPFFM